MDYPKSYDEMSIWELSQLLHLCTHDHLLHFVDKEGKEIHLQVERAEHGKIVFSQMLEGNHKPKEK